VDPDPAIFVIDLQDASKKLILNTIFSAYYFLNVHLHHVSKIKSQKESQKKRNQGFSYYFCMMMGGSGSGSERPKNIWIQIRIQNTASVVTEKKFVSIKINCFFQENLKMARVKKEKKGELSPGKRGVGHAIKKNKQKPVQGITRLPPARSAQRKALGAVKDKAEDGEGKR
jgi:hypothetical protein